MTKPVSFTTVTGFLIGELRAACVFLKKHCHNEVLMHRRSGYFLDLGERGIDPKMFASPDSCKNKGRCLCRWHIVLLLTVLIYIYIRYALPVFTA